LEERAELVMDRDEEQSVERDTKVEPTVGGARVELWLKSKSSSVGPRVPPGSTRGPTDEDGTRVHGETGGAERLMDQGVIHGPEAQGGTASLRDRGGDWGLADQGNDGGSKDDGKAGGKEKSS